MLTCLTGAVPDFKRKAREMIIPKSEASLYEMATPSWSIQEGVVIFRCPNGHFADLSSWSIDASGKVAPSIDCHGPRLDCRFHEFIELEGWGASATPKTPSNPEPPPSRKDADEEVTADDTETQEGSTE